MPANRLDTPKTVIVVGAHAANSHSMLRYSRLLAKAYGESGVSTKLLLPPSFFARFAKTLGPRFVKWGVYLDQVLMMLRLVALAHRPDVLHFADHSDILYSLPVRTNCSVVCTVHDLFAVRAARGELEGSPPVGRLGRLYQQLVLRGLRNCDLLCPVSEATSLHCKQLIPRVPIHLLRNTTDPELARMQTPDVRMGSYQFALMVASSGWRKCRPDGFDAWLSLRGQPGFQNLALVVVGNPPTELERSSIPDRERRAVQFVSNLHDDALANLSGSCAFLLQPSKYEGFCWPVVEANLFGRPALCRDVDVLRETGGSGAVFVNFDHCDDWDNVAKELQKKGLSEACDANARRFSWSSFQGSIDMIPSLLNSLGTTRARKTGPSVLQVVPSFEASYGGPVSVAASVASRYQELGCSVETYGLFAPDQTWDGLHARGFEAWTLLSRKRHTSSLSVRACLSIVARASKADLIHIHYSRSLFTALLPLALGLLPRPKVVLQTHGMCAPWTGLGRIFDLLVTRRCLQRAQAVLCLTASEASLLSSNFGPLQAVVLPNSPRIHLAPEETKINDVVPRVLFCGRLHPRKGLHTFVASAVMLSSKIEDIEFHIVGADEGAGEKAKDTFARAGVKVSFHGGMSARDAQRWMKACDVLAHPAAREPFGMSMIEAMALGVPVVASASSELAGQFEQFGAAALCADEDPDDWADSISRVLSDFKYRDDLCSGAKDLVRAEFSEKRVRDILRLSVLTLVA